MARIGPYDVGDRLGVGATAVVHRAIDVRDGRDVALKRLRPPYGDDAAVVRRFVAQGRAATILEHPGIARVWDADVADGSAFHALELVDGGSLREALDRDGATSPDRAFAIARQLVEALAHAHDRGVVHLDVKPENVLVAGDVVKLTDFGAARFVWLGSLTGASNVWGTPEYAPPEAFRTRVADPRRDLYAVGALWFELLVGRPPWSRAEALARALRSDAQAPARLETGAGEGVDALLSSLLAPAPADRPATAGELLARMDALVTGLPVALATNHGRCFACAAQTPAGAARCFACGAEQLALEHDEGGRWAVVLRRLADDADASERLTRVLDAVADPAVRDVEFMVGPAQLYTLEEQKRLVGLPAPLFTDLDEATARRLEALLKANGLDVVAAQARWGRAKRAAAGASWSWRSAVAIALSATPLLLMKGTATLAVIPAFIAGSLSLWHWTTRHPLRRHGAFRLRSRALAARPPDPALEALATLGRACADHDLRRLVRDLASAVHEVRASRTSDELVERATSPALLEHLASLAARVEAIDVELAASPESALVATLARLDRIDARASAARVQERDRAMAQLDLVHELQTERARLVTQLCDALATLRALLWRLAAASD